jgi:hypothetical protein
MIRKKEGRKGKDERKEGEKGGREGGRKEGRKKEVSLMTVEENEMKVREIL